jgi:hypothetical protein
MRIAGDVLSQLRSSCLSHHTERRVGVDLGAMMSSGTYGLANAAGVVGADGRS